MKQTANADPQSITSRGHETKWEIPVRKENSGSCLAVSRESARPLEAVEVSVHTPGRLVVFDGAHREYHRQQVVDRATVIISGSQGTHLFRLTGLDDTVLGECRVRVVARTRIDDSSGRWRQFVDLLHWGLRNDQVANSVVRYEGRGYRTFSFCVPRDHALILNGERYFTADLEDGVELCAATQHDDGMIYELFSSHDPRRLLELDRFRDPRYMRLAEGGTTCMQRVPVEPDCEFFFVLMLYATWMANGDDRWMASHLAAAGRALLHTRNDPDRWSTVFNLPKRVLTLDMWDFTGLADTARTGDNMELHPEKMRFGVMHGDSTGYAAACRALATMLEVAGRGSEAEPWRLLADEVYERLVRVAWKGDYFGHFQYEHPETVDEDFGPGVDPATQLSLSNALALNRGIPHKHAVRIVRRYKRLRSELPADCAAEFVTMWPFFEKGWLAIPGRYVNGGVMGLVGGELAQGALEHGEEAYGVDLLQRTHRMLVEKGGTFPYEWHGRKTSGDPGALTTLDLRPYCNAGFAGEDKNGIPGWTGQGSSNDLSAIPVGRMEAHGIPLEVIDAGTNNGRSCLLIDDGRRGVREITIPVNAAMPAIYLHHTLSAISRDDLLGWITVHYTDGTTHQRYIRQNREIANWWDPVDLTPQGNQHSITSGYDTRVAWRGRNARTWVGTYVWGWNHPHPEKTIDHLTFTNSGLASNWFLLGLTLGSKPKWLGTDPERLNFIANWHSAACLSAIFEGLCGVKSTAPAMRRVILSPRWAATDETEVECCAAYPGSGGYCAYRFRREADALELLIASADDKLHLEILMPPGRTPGRVIVNGHAAEFETRMVEQSCYVSMTLAGYGAATVRVETIS